MIKKDLFEFHYGDKSWFFTSSKKPITYNGNTYLPKVLNRTDIDDEDIDKCDTEIAFPYPMQILNADGDDLQALFINKIYFKSVTVVVIELYKEQSLVIFKGRVTQPQFDTKAHTMTLTCSTAETQQRRNILTRKYQRMCPNKIYDKYCGLNIDDWAIDAEVFSISKLSVELIIDNPPDDIDKFFNRGILIFNGIAVFITSNSDYTISLYRDVPNLKKGDIVKIAPGCNQTHKMCHEKFDNTFNFAGFPFMPNENPVYKEIIK